MEMNGIVIGLFELLIFFLITYSVKKCSKNLNQVGNVTYYWLNMTVLTAIWEFFYVYNNTAIRLYSHHLWADKQHVWLNEYDISFLLPNKLAKIFYAEYGAYADREYMFTKDNWSKTIEGTHAIFCGFFAFVALTLKRENYLKKCNLAIGMSMGSQLMNSMLYMTAYFIQCGDKYSENFDTKNFPVGNWLVGRPFMWVNIFWTVMPVWVLINHFIDCKKPDIEDNIVKNVYDEDYIKNKMYIQMKD